METTSSPKTQLPRTINQATTKLSLSKPLQEINDRLLMPGKKTGSPVEKEKKRFPVLFYGRKRSGKFTYATMLATLVGKELYKVDLSLLNSNYIGETEKIFPHYLPKRKIMDGFYFLMKQIHYLEGERKLKIRMTNMLIRKLLI